MIDVTLLNGNKVYINPNLLELVESTPDTILTLTTGRKLMVKETPKEIAKRFTEFAARVNQLASEKEDILWT